MNKVGIVLGVAAAVTIVGCKDADYQSRRFSSQDEAKVVETEPISAPVVEEKQAEEPKKEEAKVDEVVAPVEPEYTLYIVQRGDSLSKISKKYNIKIDAIKALNGMKNDTVKLGQKIKLPGKVDVGAQAVPAGAMAESKKPAPAKEVKPYQGETVEYVVKSGDTLGGIAYGHGIKIRQLKQLNGLKGDALRVGQKLKVPAGSVKTTAVKEKPAEQKPVEPKAAEEKPTTDAPVEPQPVEKPAEEKAEDAAAVSAPLSYVVQEGEDLLGISVDWGVSAAAICELNNLSESDKLTPGQVIKLPPEAQK